MEKIKPNLQYIQTVTLRTLEDIAQRKRERNLPPNTSFSIKQSHLFPEHEMTIRNASDMAIFLSSPSLCEKYGRWAIAPERNAQGDRVVVFVPVPEIPDVEEL
ncbi:hypothetical protein pEaSNUABM40_00312 [Erwinia phage pEa_SNUABM_40]|uniref:Uncharacterized protein n=1 Tax=Erwinia phage pEa_SNUABM_3 TaxID=2869552 RepID=A0AAE7XJR4_9CAUD|nr:hypothetical protein MPK68_gp310 [Erwinia phage pEa_SNUABM_3]QZE56844.1 hypothetical protein pEaSNUABM20_00308 [Erwinia phage pEa_SNUABM_20]QZE58528.1 hypothetical protein pEaSNUABM40_00312 [Erwinia phage pEa_SNUABM_40]UAW53089.1 hypothetical protein pEaSNUABM23_00307 [Erwinia phage pEa_SNUABM_23]UIW10984.1 hypothetical protein pEaSNUABM23_00307 [Erwinia phage pEa_SNUABM_31]QZE56507.1 hypothetical protein pEaSNUABM3_00310 [Erwinia phage pEa_SNUABM_3]